MKILLVCVLLLSVSGGGLSAQPLPEPVYTRPDGVYGLFPEWLTWTANDRLAFYSENVDLSDRGTYFVYDLETGLSQENDPFTAQLTAEQREHFRAAVDTAYVDPTDNNFVYVSQFDVYRVGEGGSFVKLFAVGNFDSETFLPLTIGDTQSIPTVLWSEDRSTLVIGIDSPLSDGTSFYNVRKQDNCGPTFCKYVEMFMAGVAGSNTIFDLSSDGKRALFPFGYESGLRLWDIETVNEIPPDDYTELLVTQEKVIGAAFVPDNDDQILMVTEQGILLHTLSSGESEIINTDINATWASWVTFSPDNQWAALLEGADFFRDRLYVLPV